MRALSLVDIANQASASAKTSLVGGIARIHHKVATTTATGFRALEVLTHALGFGAVFQHRQRGGDRHRDHVELVAKRMAPMTIGILVQRPIHASASRVRRRASWLWIVRTLTPNARAVRVRSLSK